MNTIKVPRNLQVTLGKLPPPEYETDEQRFGGMAADLEERDQVGPLSLGSNYLRMADDEEERDQVGHLPALASAQAKNGYTRQAEPLVAQHVQAGHQYSAAPAISDAMMFPKKVPPQSQAGRDPSPAYQRPPPSRANQDSSPPYQRPPPVQQPATPTNPSAYPNPPSSAYPNPPASAYPASSAYDRQGPPPSAYEAIRKAQQRGVYLNDDNSPWQYPKPVAPKISESHAAYGAFYNSPKAPPAISKQQNNNPMWAAADMFANYTPQQQQVARAHAPSPQGQAYRGHYNPYSENGGNGNGNQQRHQKLPSVAVQRQQAAMARLAYGGGGKAPLPPAWNAGAGARAKEQRMQQIAAKHPELRIAGNNNAISRYPPMQWQAPKAAARCGRPPRLPPGGELAARLAPEAAARW
eukprot:gene11206-18826_t